MLVTSSLKISILGGKNVKTTNIINIAITKYLDISSYFILIFLLVFMGLIMYFYKSKNKFRYFIHKILVTRIFLIKDVYFNMQMGLLLWLFAILIMVCSEFNRKLTKA